MVMKKTLSKLLKKVIEFISFKFGNDQLLDFLKLLDGVTIFDALHKAYKTKLSF